MLFRFPGGTAHRGVKYALGFLSDMAEKEFYRYIRGL